MLTDLTPKRRDELRHLLRGTRWGEVTAEALFASAARTHKRDGQPINAEALGHALARLQNREIEGETLRQLGKVAHELFVRLGLLEDTD